jgi:glycogen synthase
MNILMMTNTYFPMVGGLEQSVYSFSEAFRSLGHEVLIVTPAFGDAPIEERYSNPGFPKIWRNCFFR